MINPNHSRTDSPAYSDYTNSFPGGCACPVSRTLCPDCGKYLPGDEWICKACLYERCSSWSEEMYGLLKQITNPNRWGKELAADIEAARTLCMQIEEGSR